ncbi:unnamed protein product [Calicophoron daubneyi]|uniref:Uncharacterized protein n=1 Tax=Calicophoron daubneyi TaxID=300641 RepID=A0AAV2T963_CALDB
MRKLEVKCEDGLVSSPQALSISGAIDRAVLLKTSTATTTTLVPGIIQPSGLAPLDILSRYPLHSFLLERFAPSGIYLDRYISPLWLPFALIGCSVCVVVYGLANWRQPVRNPSGPSSRPSVSAGPAAYITVMAVLYLVHDLLTILIDIDTAWNTGLLAWNQLSCPLSHAFFSATGWAISVLTLTLGIEVLFIIYRKPKPYENKRFRWLIAQGHPRKALHISIAIVLVTSLLGLIETVYWRVQYYLPNTIHNPFYTGSFGSAENPLARCEVAGRFQHLFLTKLRRLDVVGRLDETGRYDMSTSLASSYADYKWISGITIETTLSLANICLALTIVRAKLVDAEFTRLLARRSDVDPNTVRMHMIEVTHIAALCLIQGLCHLPEALLVMLEPLTGPGEVNLTDTELELDRTWQRYFLMVTARVVGQEIAELPAALLLPICLGLSRRFRRDFCLIFGCGKMDDETDISSADQRIPLQRSGGEVFTSIAPSTLSPTSSQRYVPDVADDICRQRTDPHDSPYEEARPLWKWGRGWTWAHGELAPQNQRGVRVEQPQIIHQPSNMYRAYNAPTAHRALDRRKPYHESNTQLFPPYANSSVAGSWSTLRTDNSTQHRRRSSSANDLLLGQSATSWNTLTSLPRRGEVEVDWFEPRSYV